MTLVYLSTCGEDHDTVHDFLIDLTNTFSEECFLYYKRCVSRGADNNEPESIFHFFADQLITNEILKNFWEGFYGEDYKGFPL